MKKSRVIRVIWVMIALVALFSTAAWFYYEPTKPIMALYVAMAGGVVILNFVIALFFVSKNFRG